MGIPLVVSIFARTTLLVAKQYRAAYTIGFGLGIRHDLCKARTRQPGSDSPDGRQGADRLARLLGLLAVTVGRGGLRLLESLEPRSADRTRGDLDAEQPRRLLAGELGLLLRSEAIGRGILGDAAERDPHDVRAVGGGL